MGEIQVVLRGANNTLYTLVNQNELVCPLEIKEVSKCIKLKTREGGNCSLYIVNENINRDWVDVSDLPSLKDNHGEILCEAIGSFYSFMPDHLSDTKVPELFLKKEIKDSITFYGGTFNPWHEGHRRCLDLVGTDDIVVVPDNNPFKGQDMEGCSFQNFLKLALELKDTKYSLYPGFWGSDKGNPTSEWLPNVKVEKKSLIIGEDNFLTLDKWINIEKIMDSLSKLFVIARGERENEIEAQKKWANRNWPNIEIIYLIDNPYQDVSSTKIRNAQKS